jgi:hypothetical protein
VSGGAVGLSSVLSVGNTTGPNPILVTAGQRIDSATGAVLSIGTVTATSVDIGSPTIPVTMTGWLNVGNTTLATGQGDLSAGLTGGGNSRLFFDQSARTLRVTPGTATDPCEFSIGDTAARGALRILSYQGSGDAYIRGSDHPTTGTGTNLVIESGTGVGGFSNGGTLLLVAGNGNETRGGDVRVIGGTSTVTALGTASGAQIRAQGGQGTLGGATLSGGQAQVLGGNTTIDGYSGGSVTIAGGEATTVNGGAVVLRGGAATNGTAGGVGIDSGAVTGAGTNGSVYIGNVNAATVNLGRAGQSLGFFGVTAVTQRGPYTRNATVVEDRTLLASASASNVNNNNVLAALIGDLQAYGLFG